MINEVTIQNKSWKKMILFQENNELVNDALKEFAYANYSEDYLSVEYFGTIGKDFRVLMLIGEAKDENKISSIDKQKLDKELDFGVYDLSSKIDIQCTCIKLNEKEILKEVLKYISQERFDGGYYAKGKFVGNNTDNLIFVGVSGDYRDKKLRNINLDKLINENRH